MKKALLIIMVLAVATTAGAALTTEEEETVTQLHANKAKVIQLIADAQTLQDIVANLGLETVPLQIKQKRDAITVVVNQRHADIDAVKAQAIADIQVIEDAAQVTIDGLNADIAALEALLP